MQPLYGPVSPKRPLQKEPSEPPNPRVQPKGRSPEPLDIRLHVRSFDHGSCSDFGEEPFLDFPLWFLLELCSRMVDTKPNEELHSKGSK